MEKKKISPSSWQASLRDLLKPRTAEVRLAIIGIGNRFRSDDAAGVLVADQLLDFVCRQNLGSVLVIDAGHAPENTTAALRRFAPSLVLLIDAADMGAQPGAIRLIELDEIDGVSASTHTLPLSMLAQYLMLELACNVKLLGIQPKSNEVTENVSAEVCQAVAAVVATLTSLIRCEDPMPVL